MNTENLKTLAFETLKTTAAITAVNALNVPRMIGEAVPKNKIGRHAATGASYALANDAVRFFTTRKSNILEMKPWDVADDVAFFSIVSGVATETGGAVKVYETLKTVLPFEDDMKKNVVDGLIVAGASLTANFMDISTGTNPVFDFTRRPVSTIMNRLR